MQGGSLFNVRFGISEILEEELTVVAVNRGMQDQLTALSRSQAYSLRL